LLFLRLRQQGRMRQYRLRLLQDKLLLRLTSRIALR